MVTKLFRRKDKVWNVYTREVQDLTVIEVTDHPSYVLRSSPHIFIDLLANVFYQHQTVALSQLIDRRQEEETIGKAEEYASMLRRQFHVQSTFSITYDSAAVPGDTSDLFVVHVAGSVSRPLLEELLRFGIADLSNIAYGLEGIVEPWPARTLSWNNTFVRWFRLQEPKSSILRLLEQVDLLAWTADSHLWFSALKQDEVTRILRHVEKIGQRNGLRPVIQHAESL